MDQEAARTRKAPAHARGRTPQPVASEQGLRGLGRQAQAHDDEFSIASGLRASRRRRRVLGWGAFLVVLALLAGGVAQWVRPLPRDAVHVTRAELPGAAPSLAWPSSGQAAVAVAGLGTMGQSGGSSPVPVAGLADVLTAYLIVKDHPLNPGSDGPSIPVGADTLNSFAAGQAQQLSEVPVSAGESLTELQALEGLLVDGGADMATLLADWDAGSTGAFVTKMNAAAAGLAMASTHITDPSGVDPATTSTAADLVRLGEATMAVPVLAQIVSLGQADVPMTSVVYNLNFDLGRDGIVGIKSSSDARAQGCYLFAARQSIGGAPVTVVGAVLGQQGGALGPNTAAVDAGDTLLKSAFATLHPQAVFAPGQTAGRVTAPWGASAPLTVDKPVQVIGWPGLAVSAAVHPFVLHGAQPSGAVVGVLRAGVGGSTTRVQLRTVAPLAGPGVWWRLTR
jgi:serine-type D-Ala-D-Ala carboxypeptidase (penicillin-binding protein 5/6)